MGVDIGGTFVDFALWDGGREIAVHKVPAEAGGLAGSIMRGIAELAERRGADVRTFLGATALLVHGTTVATNAVLTGSGSRTGLLTTSGTRDALEMRRGVKEEPLDNKYVAAPPLVPRYLRLPVDERVDWNGNVLEALDRGWLEAAVDALKSDEVEAIAVCLMHAYANDAYERRVAERLRAGGLPEAYLTVSSELGYYSRVSTAVLNSYVGPLLESYLSTLSAALAEAGFAGQLLIMNSAAGLMAPVEIIPRAAAALLSGPAAAPVTARVYAGAAGAPHCAVIDMGGTSLDISLASDGEPREVTEGRIGRYATALPMIDIRTIGCRRRQHRSHRRRRRPPGRPPERGGRAGTGLLRQGRHASHLHGRRPACWAILMPATSSAGGYGSFASRRSGAVRGAPGRAARNIRRRGGGGRLRGRERRHGLGHPRHDRVARPRSRGQCPWWCGGGAGPVHAAAVAMELGVREVIVPRQSGVFCAVGMLFADLKHDLVRSYCASGEQLDRECLRAPLRRHGRGRPRHAGVGRSAPRRRWRYATPRISATCARSTNSTCR